MDFMYKDYYANFCIACTTENISLLDYIYSQGFIDLNVLKTAYERKKNVYNWCVSKNIHF